MCQDRQRCDSETEDCKLMKNAGIKGTVHTKVPTTWSVITLSNWLIISGKRNCWFSNVFLKKEICVTVF